jgi:hypothetical protein
MPALGALATRYCSGLAGTPLFMTNDYHPINGKRGSEFPGPCPDLHCKGREMSVASYLKKHCEALVKDVGIEAACEITGKSKATLGRYYSENDEHGDRFMPVDVVAQLEGASRFPHVTSALADLRGITLSYDADKRNAASSGVNQDVVALAQRFALLMSEYNMAISDGKISINEAKRLLRETLALQQVLLEMKLNLEQEAQ